jgi:hypothetical protein
MMVDALVEKKRAGRNGDIHVRIHSHIDLDSVCCSDNGVAIGKDVLFASKRAFALVNGEFCSSARKFVKECFRANSSGIVLDFVLLARTSRMYGTARA